MSGAGVQLEGLSIDFLTPAGRAAAVRDVSLQMAPGEMRGLVGESGSGKSTVALAFLGLLAPNARVTAGRLTLGGQGYDLGKGDVSSLRGRDIAMIFQDPAASLNPVFRIGAHLDEVVHLREPGLGRAARRGLAVEALATVGMTRPEARLDQWPHELSGGMRQRVVIAMALLARPKLLIADEPTTALDVSVEAQVMDQISALRDQIGCSVLLITHSLGLVGRYCDSVTVMYAGEMVEEGPVAAVMARAAHPYTGRLLDCDVEIDHPLAATPEAERFAIIAGQLPDLHALPAGCIFQPRCSAADDRCRTRPAMRPVNGTGDHLARCWVTP
jgi:oligopeptide/dipeptide ABC transporter ATP-binding protein